MRDAADQGLKQRLRRRNIWNDGCNPISCVLSRASYLCEPSVYCWKLCLYRETCPLVCVPIPEGLPRTCELEQYSIGYLLRFEDGETRLFQTDWDFPGLASLFGWAPCDCGMTDGTVDCPHKTVDQMLGEAQEYLDAHVGDVTLDPGY